MYVIRYINDIFTERLTDNIFSFISELARDLLGFADQGTSFLTSPDVPKLGEKGPEMRDTYKTADNDIGWFLVGVLRKSAEPIQFVKSTPRAIEKRPIL